MAVTLDAGAVVNTCDSLTGFSAGGVDNDIFIQGTGSVGSKTSASTSVYTTTSITGGNRNFASGGGAFGWHIVVWFNALTPINATTGFQIAIAQGANTGRWNTPPVNYTGGFRSKVINPALAFDVSSGFAGSNPSQLTAVSAFGGAITTTTSIMGNFNNTLVDQFTIGTGLRIDGVGNSFETLRAADEDTNKWGWVTSSSGSFIVKGGVFIGPATGTATSTFTDTAAVVTFANERVATGFYQINMRGTGTTTTLTGCIIRSETTSARWSLILDGTSIPVLNDNGSLFQGFDVITLRSGSTLTNTRLDNGNKVNQNNATLNGCRILNSNSGVGVALITSDDLSKIQNCNFDFASGHAIELTSAHAASPTAYTFTGNTFNGYGGTAGTNLTANSGSTTAAIYNNSGKHLIINISGGTTPSVRNGASSTTTVNNNVSVTVSVVDQSNNPLPGVEVSIFQNDTAKTVILASTPTNQSGTVSTSAAASLGSIIIRARQSANIAKFGTTSGVNGTTEVVTTNANHHLQKGDPVVYSKNGGSASIGLTAGTTYYVNRISNNTLSLHTTAANAIADTSRVNLTASGAETHFLTLTRYFPASSTGTIGTGDFSAQITMVRDEVATG